MDPISDLIPALEPSPFRSLRRRRPGAVAGAVLLSLILLLPLLPGAPLAAQPFEVEGRVEAVEGGVPRGVTVELVPARSELQLDLAALGEPPEAGSREVRSRVRTGVQPDGSFRLSAPEPGLWIVRVEAPNRIPLEHTPELLQDLRVLDTAVLMPAEELEVLVTDLAGRPRSGARVEVRPAKEWREHRLRSFHPARRSAVTGEDGRARLVRAIGEEVVVRACGAEGPESPEVRLSGRQRAPEEPVRIVLPEGVVRDLTVREAGGDPAAGFGVRLGEWGWPVALTDERGKARVRIGSETTRVEILNPAGWTTRVSLVPGTALNRVDLELPPPVEITGVVLDRQTREPLAGAWVWRSSERRELIGSFVSTDRAGGFRLEVAPATQVRLYAAALEHQPWWFDRPVEAGRIEDLRILLPKATVIRGRLIDEAGEPVVDGDVRVRPAGLWSSSWKSRRGVIWVKTGAEGRFRIPALAAEIFELRAAAEGFAPVELRRERSELVDPLEIVLLAGEAITGRAVNPDGEPLEGVEVSVFEALEGSRAWMAREDRELADRGVTGPDGVFLAEHLRAEIFDVELRAPGRAPRLLSGVDPSGEGAGSGEPLDLGDLLLQPGVALEGRVVGPGGDPLEGAEVQVGKFLPGIGVSVEPPSGLVLRKATTDDEGRFVVEDLQREQLLTVWAKAPGHVADVFRGIEPPTERSLEIRLERGVRVFGRVVDPEGSPVSDARVQVAMRKAQDPGRRRYWGGSDRTAEDGSFELDTVPRGELSVEVQATGYLTLQRRDLSTASGADLGPVEIRLESGAAVAGRVLDGTGVPVAGAHVRASYEIGEHRMSSVSDRSGPDGRFEITGLPPGPVQVAATYEDQEAKEDLDLSSGGAVVDLVLGPAEGLLGRVVDPHGRPVPRSLVRVETSGGGDSRTHSDRADPLGRFRIDLEAGDYRVSVFSPGFAESVVDPVRYDGGVQRIEIRLRRGAVLTGRLLGLAPEERSEIRIHAHSKGHFRGIEGRVTFDGGYRIEGLSPGTWQVEAQAEGMSARGTVEIQEGHESATLDLEFPDGLTLTGVLLRNGEPVVDLSLYLTPAKVNVGASHSASTNYGGRFRFRGVEPGEYRLWGHDFRAGWQVERRVEVWGDREIRIETWATRVTGTVVDAGGLPVPEARVQLVPLVVEIGTLVSSTSIQTDEDGRFVLPAVEEGGWQLVLQADGRGTRIEEIQVSGAEMDLGTLVLEEGAGLVLEPRLVSGEIPERVILVLVDPQTSRPAFEQTRPVEPDGYARFEGLPPGSWNATVVTQETVPSLIPLDIPAGGLTDPLPVALEPRTELHVQVPELKGAGVQARALVRDPSGMPHNFFGLLDLAAGRAWPVMDGELRIPILPAGSWTVEITADDGRVWTGTATTRPGEPAVLVLE